MKDTRKIRLVSQDNKLERQLAAAAKGIAGWELGPAVTLAAALADPGSPKDVILLDVALSGANPYEAIRRLTTPNHRRLYLVVPEANPLAEPIARFCGATGVFEASISKDNLAAELAAYDTRSPRPDGLGETMAILPEALLRELEAESTRPSGLIEALADPETSLFNYDFLTYKLDEELKRARRFHQPLSVVMLGFDGQASEDVLRQLSGLFLQAARDTDLLGRFDLSSFLFLLPHTPPGGAEIMARRIQSAADDMGLLDLVGDPLSIAVGIASFPHPDVVRAGDLYRLAREAYLEAERRGGAVLVAR